MGNFFYSRITEYTVLRKCRVVYIKRTNNDNNNNKYNNLPNYIILSMSDLHPWCESHSDFLQSRTEADETVEH
jgi:hypothetical protein